MDVREGKNIERLLAGRVNHPVSDQELKGNAEKHRGINNFRRKILNALGKEMNLVRQDQAEKNPANPKGVFAKNFVADVEFALEDITEIDEGERYEVRFYSAVDTNLDFTQSFDCWIELFDLKHNKTVADFKIDLTTNPNKHAPRNSAEHVYYFSPEFVDVDYKGEINPEVFKSASYSTLTERASAVLREKANIKRRD